MKIIINDDFDLYKIAYSGQCFRVRELSKNKFRFITGNHVVDIEDCGEFLEVSTDENEWNLVWKEYFDLNTNYEAIRKTIPSNDIYLMQSAAIGEGIRILKQDKFEMLISFIISQRKSIPAIKSSVEKLCRKYGSKLAELEGEIIYAFPTPKNLSEATEDELKECGLGYRVPYIINAANMVYHNEVDLDKLSLLDDESLFEELKKFYGVGDKVSNCVCLFAYHRTALAPVDTWINKVINSQYNGVNPFPGYGNVAGIMQQYIFFAAQHEHEL